MLVRYRICLKMTLLLVMSAGSVIAWPAGLHAQEQVSSPGTDATAKVPASADVKEVMAEIRQRVLDTHTLITHRRLSPQAGRAFSKSITGLAVRLEEAGPDHATGQISELLKEGAHVIGQPPSGNAHLDGLQKIEIALNLYSKLFEDDDWKPLR